jgi:hypothetical protein
VYKVCDGTPQKPVFAVVPDHHAGKARALMEGRYGEILLLENILVRSNPSRDAFNLFVDRSSRVEAIGGRKDIAKILRGEETEVKGGRRSDR